MNADDSSAARAGNRRGWLWRGLLRLVLVLPWIAIVFGAIYAATRFLPDEPVTYADPVEHFKYGSTGGERESGFPYWIWQALPQVCAAHLPGAGYASLGMIFEADKDLPVGVSKRRHLGLDRVFLNCAACHASTVRDAPGAGPPQGGGSPPGGQRSVGANTPGAGPPQAGGSPPGGQRSVGAHPSGAPRLVTGMPAQRFDIRAFESFFFNCAADPKFSREFIVPEIERLTGGLDLIDRWLVYPVAIALMRERVLMLRGRFAFVMRQPEWGPGRVDTFNSAKVLFNFPMDRLAPQELLGASDFPSIWNQRARMSRDDGRRMELHWDGNNTHTEERNKSAAFGTGTTPPTIDLAAIGRVEEWLLEARPPPWPHAVDVALADRGRALYGEYCAACHGTSGQDFKGARVGHVTPIADIGTDRARLDSYTHELAVNQATLYAGYPHRFQHFRKTFGYANMPLDGLWLRGPYLHNGSVPTVRDLLEPAAARPQTFHRGNDVIDRQRLGFVSDQPEAGGRRFFLFDTRQPGNGNAGHEGKAYGTELAAAEKDALVEYLKTF